LRGAGINANVLNVHRDLFLLMANQEEGVQLIVPAAQLEKARKILKIKFILQIRKSQNHYR
jgi:hypothetical protein